MSHRHASAFAPGVCSDDRENKGRRKGLVTTTRTEHQRLRTIRGPSAARPRTIHRRSTPADCPLGTRRSSAGGLLPRHFRTQRGVRALLAAAAPSAYPREYIGDANDGATDHLRMSGASLVDEQRTAFGAAEIKGAPAFKPATKGRFQRVDSIYGNQ
ncbi:hypothetical protein B0H17DRAFT_1129868 [Mycena rosella]|uniref:Uncharacterized protein n=1 Tax=Mycena rosella TaxID=1033263 RepID=A0AAD7DRX4_MYCRO|nr:hypothetical protein B0H17DRAFT_1129868 [Mycena rosella]